MTRGGIFQQLISTLPKAGDMSPDGLSVRVKLKPSEQLVRLFQLAAVVFLGVGLVCFVTSFGLGLDAPVVTAVVSTVIAAAVSGYLFFKFGLAYEWAPSPLGLWLEKNVPRENQAEVPNSGTTSGESAFESIGGLAGLFGGAVAFIAVYVAAIGAAGWVIGIALGWIPALLAAFLIGLLCRYLWWLVLIGIVMLILMLQ